MPWKKLKVSALADDLGVDINEIDQKLKLREMIVKVRVAKSLSQDELASLVGVSRSRIAQIEAGIKLHKMSFDILLRVLNALGYRYTINAKKLAA
jgi:transcriptional regulator with XRE-family HTH domain